MSRSSLLPPQLEKTADLEAGPACGLNRICIVDFVMGNYVVRCASGEARSDIRDVASSGGASATKASSSSPDSSSTSPQQQPGDPSSFPPVSQSGDGVLGGAGDSDTCPGSFDELHKKCKDVYPINFEGAKFMIQKGLNQHFQVSHTVTLSPAVNSYRFGATYVGTKQLGPQEAYPVFLVDTEVTGNQTATAVHQIGQLRCRFASQIQEGKFNGAQGTAEWRGRVSTVGLTVANPDLVNESGILVGQFLRRVHPKIDLGMEYVYQYGKQIPGGQISVLSYAARYNGRKCTASGSIGKSGLHLCYYHKQQENLQFGVEWETNLRLAESVASLAYQVDLPKANVTFRATADSNYTVGAVLEKKMLPLPFTFALSGMINHARNQSKFGIGLIIG